MTPQFIIILVIVVFVLGTFAGFMIGFSRAMREAAKNRLSRVPPAITWSVICVGCLALAGTLIVSLYTWHFTRIATHTTGTVIEMVAEIVPDSNNVTYTPKFRFQDAHGEQQTVTSHFCLSAFHVGESVRVLYLPEYPEGARIDTWFLIWGLPTALGIFSGVGLSIGLIMLSWPAIVAKFRISQSAPQNP